ncbi:EspG family protein [Nocardia amikacinitolerans]|uniref:ESX secretion-associated protein EspG n=1 Tax=Nocardia amikacinitolerans TaxID=756689 RepID=UPI0020A5AEBF|nr:ESX secretion-associated protein EspG [Nocardia amikacinitolerans]MCP2295813.1 EspG family protein [Nocardia amikacinitolerans]
MTPQTWTMSALELTVLWHAIGREILPYPLCHKPTEQTTEEYDRAYRAAAAHVATLFDEDMYGPLRVLVEPEARIEVAGFAGACPGVLPGAEPDPIALVRMHAAVSGRSAVLLTQEPTHDPNRGGPVRMSLIGAHTLPHRIIAALPPTPSGTGTGFHINRADLDIADDHPFTAFTDDAPVSRRTQARDFFERPRSTVAHVAVYPGPAYDNRPTPRRDFHVMDYPDGRYRIHAATAIQSTPTTTPALVTHLRTLLDHTLREHREDNDPTYPDR